MLFKDKFYLCSKCHEWHGIKYEAEIQSSDKVQQGVAEPAREEEAYGPRVGDRVSLDGVVVELHRDGIVCVEVDGTVLHAVDARKLTLLSRAPRTLTKAEAEVLLTEKLGESVRIE